MKFCPDCGERVEKVSGMTLGAHIDLYGCPKCDVMWKDHCSRGRRTIKNPYLEPIACF